MRAPGWDRKSFASRWAPAVALLTASLAFIALAVLLIPTQFITTPQTAETAGSIERVRAPSRPAPFNTSLLPAEDASAIGSPVSAAPRAAAPALRAAAPAPELAIADAAGAAQPVFAPNIAARGDRPTPPARRTAEKRGTLPNGSPARPRADGAP